ERSHDFAVTSAGLAEAGVATVGASAAVTITLAVPLLPALVAVRVKGPPTVLPATKRPLVLTVPPPVAAQVNAGCAPSTAPNWSLAAALKASMPPTGTLAEPGVTLMVVSTALTV